MSNSTKQWFSLYTKPGCEKRVASLLSRKSIDNYCPLKGKWKGRKMVVSEPLFNSYVFVHIIETDMQKIRLIDGVLNFVYWLGKPAIIEDEDIAIIKRFTNEYSCVKLEKVPFNTGDMVRGIEGVEGGFNASKVTIKNNVVHILLASLGYMMIAEVAHSNMELVPAKKEAYSFIERYQYSFKNMLSFQ